MLVGPFGVPALSLYIQAENVKQPLVSFFTSEDMEVQEGKDLDKTLRLEQIFLDSAFSFFPLDGFKRKLRSV